MAVASRASRKSTIGVIAVMVIVALIIAIIVYTNPPGAGVMTLHTTESLPTSAATAVSQTTSSVSTSTSSMSTTTSFNLGDCPCGSTTTTSITYELNPCNCTLNITWPYTYQTTHALAAASDYIVVANVTSKSTVAEGSYQAQSGDSSGAQGIIPSTFYNITVLQTIEPIRGPPSNLTAGTIITVGQVGGVAYGSNMSVSGYPTLSLGSEYVFFLGDSGSFLTSYLVYHGIAQFITMGGTQGLFYVQGGKVYSLDNLYPQADAWLPVKVAGVPLAQFVSEVQSAWNSTISSTSG